MNIRILFVPPGGGEADYGMELRTDMVPRVGEYMTLVFREHDERYSGAFRVLMVNHEGQMTSQGVMDVDGITVQLEPVDHPWVISGPWFDQIQRWKKNPEFRDRVKEYPNTGY